MQTKDLQLKRALRTALLVLLLGVVGMMKGYAYFDFSAVCPTGQTLYYTITDATNHYVELSCPEAPVWGFNWSGYTRPTGEIILPEDVEYNGDTYTVTSIGEYAFAFCYELTGSLIVPNTIITIEKEAFCMCGFNGTLTIGNAVTTIGEGSFYGCTGFIGNLVIPNSLTTIYGFDDSDFMEYSYGAFESCSGFTSLTLSNSLTMIGWNAFADCSGLTGNVDIPNSVTIIGRGAFQNCSGLTGNVNIPNSVTIIGSIAFYNCSGLISFNLPNSVSSIGIDAFTGTGWYNNQPDNTIIYLDGCCIGYKGSTPSGNLQIVEGTRLIAGAAFRYCSGFTGSLVIPNTVMEIGEEAFYGCSGFTGSLTIGNSVTTIGRGAFYNCCGFTGNLIIPNSVTTIGWYNEYGSSSDWGAFSGCCGFTGDLIIPNSVTLIGNDCFSGCSSFSGALTIPNSVTKIGQRAFGGCSGFNGSLVLLNSVTINYYVFSGCSGFTSIVCFAEAPPVIINDYNYYNNPFFNWDFNIPVYVSCNSIEAYASISWGGFSNFIEMCGGTVTVSANPEEGGTVTGGGSYEPGQTCTVTATANEGYCFIFWTEDGVTVSFDTNYSFYVAGDHDLVAHFALPFTVSATADPIEGGIIEGTGLYDYGTLATLTAIANDGYVFYNWTQNDTIISTNTEYSIEMFDNVDLVAHFIIDGNITFLDPNVKAICVAHWDTNGDGELSYLEAAQVTDLGNWFQGNTIITSFNELQYFIGLSAIPNNAFQNCTGLTSITLPPTIVTIGNYAFSGCIGLFGLLTLPNALTTIGDYAYYNCSGFIASLTIPNTVTAIGNHAFENCTGFMGLLTIGNSVVTIGESAFLGCVNFTGSINIPNSVINIGNNAFYGCTAFWGTLTIGNLVATIGSNAFYGCTGLVGDVEIPNSVHSIGSQAFYNCHSFEGSLTIPASVTSIGSGAFSSCYGFSAVYYNATSCADCPSSAFSNCSGTITIGDNVQRIPANIFKSANFIDGLTIPNSVTTIGASAFYNCDDLTGSLVIPNSVTSVGTYAFYNCHSFDGTLTLSNAMNMIAQSTFQNCYGFTGDLDIPSSVVSIADDAFHNCQHFTGTLVLPNPLNTIGISAFEDCDGLSEIIMGNNVLVVGNTSFKSCSGLTKVTLPYPVTVIGIEAFRDCTQLVEVNIQSMTAPSIGWDVFTNNASGRVINIPCGALPNFAAGYWSEWQDALHEMCDGYVITAVVNPTEAGSVTGAGTYNYSEMCTLTATGNLGYPFINWTKNGVVVCSEPVYTFGVTETCTVVANFPAEPVSYEITATANTDEGGSVEGAGNFLYGATATLTATPNQGYHFVNWTKDGEEVSTDAEYSFTVTESGDYVANFALNIYLIAVGANPEEGGTVTSDGTSWHFGDPITLTAVPNPGYVFVIWTKDGEVVSTEPVYSFLVTESAVYSANFELESYTITVSANLEAGGTVTGGGTYNYGTTATLTATANEGYTFINWTQYGEEVSTEATYSFIVTEAGDYMANFELNTYAITATANPDAGGTVTGASIYNYGDTATLTASANDGYTFINWTLSGEEVSTEASYSFEVTEALAFVANFELITITQTTNFNNGWNWWSSYVELYDNSLTQLQDGLGASGEQIKSQNDGYASYLEGLGWYGSLGELHNEQSYRVKLNVSCTVPLQGVPTNPAEHPISIVPGWTWIGFPWSQSISIETALEGFEAETNDIIKGQNAYTMYYAENGYNLWFGPLHSFEPGRGYVYYSNSGETKTLTYHTDGSKGQQKPNPTTDNNHWQPNLNAYPDNMSVMAVVELDGEELAFRQAQGLDNYELAIFANGEVRGSARLLYVEPLDRYMAFLTVAGDEPAELHFGLYNTEIGEVEAQCITSLQYETNAIIGSFAEPYIVRFRHNTGLDEWDNFVNLFPNPVARGQRVSLGLPAEETGEVRVEIINALGTVVETRRATSLQTITAPSMVGVYTLRISIEGKGICYRKLVVR